MHSIFWKSHLLFHFCSEIHPLFTLFRPYLSHHHLLLKLFEHLPLPIKLFPSSSFPSLRKSDSSSFTLTFTPQGDPSPKLLPLQTGEGFPAIWFHSSVSCSPSTLIPITYFIIFNPPFEVNSARAKKRLSFSSLYYQSLPHCQVYHSAQ